MEGVEPDDPFQVVHCFFGAAPTGERECEPIVRKIRIEFEGALEFCAAFGGPVEPLQYCRKRQTGVSQMGI
ncbi:hypothetical protein V1286_007686 [Bradyrhizobium algeriense]|uniref:Transposase n=1 Tax=Bradyrhizobium algeriense TaxID=634784 RepID=A0ABU8BNN0_9BRAD